MRWKAVAFDYDGTLASEGRIAPATLAALERLRASGRRLVLLTGRQLDDLLRVCPRLDIFDRVVAENGALLHSPADGRETLLADPPPPILVEALRARGVRPLGVGRVIVATDDGQRTTVAAVIDELGLALRSIGNKGALMVLPAGIDKRSGLAAALEELGIEANDVVGVGDAENDSAFLARCGRSHAVADALPELRRRVDRVAAAPDGQGIVEIVEELLRMDR